MMVFSLVGCAASAAKENDCLKYVLTISEMSKDNAKLPSITGMSIKQKRIASTKYILESKTRNYQTLQRLTLELPESQKLHQKELEANQKYINALQKKVSVLSSVPDQISEAEIDKIIAPVNAEVSTAFNAQFNYDFVTYCENTKIGSQ